MIPEDWQEYQLADCIKGKPEYGANTPALDYDPHLPRYIRITDITDNGTLDNAKRASVEIAGNEQHLLQEGDFLFARSGATVGKTFLYRKDVGQAIYAGYLIRFRPDAHIVLPEYLEQYTQTAQYWAWVKSTIRAGAQPNINAQEYGNLLIPVPTVTEQRAIIDVLARWDCALGLTTQLIAAKQQRKRALMQQLLTGRRRFKAFADTPWPSLSAGEIFHPFSQRNNGDEELLSVTQEQGVLPRSMLDGRVVMPGGATASYKLVEAGDFIISLRSFQGGIEYSQYRGLVSPAYTVLKPQRPIVDGFYKHLLKSRDFIARLAVAIIGIRDGKQISFEDFAALRLAYPSIDEQRCIAEVLDACDQEIAFLNRKQALIKQQKQGLMQQLLTGKVRVTT